MEINYLIEFASIARHRSFSLAAEELCISQSSLSKHIQAVEKELGVALFDRSTRNVVISEFGKILLPYAEQLCEINDDIQGSVYDFINKEKKQLLIASIPVMAQYDITGIIAKFQKDHPAIKLIVSENEGTDIPKMLEDGSCEVAFTRKFPNEPSRFEYLTYRSDMLCAILPKSHPLAKNETLSLAQLKNENFLFLDKKTLIYGYCFNACIDAGFTPNVTYTGHRPENILDLTAQGAGVSLLMKHQAKYFNHPEVVSVLISPAIESSICLTKMKDHKLSSTGRLFWNYVKSYTDLLNLSLLE